MWVGGSTDFVAIPAEDRDSHLTARAQSAYRPAVENHVYAARISRADTSHAVSIQYLRFSRSQNATECLLPVGNDGQPSCLHRGKFDVKCRLIYWRDYGALNGPRSERRDILFRRSLLPVNFA